MSSTAQKFAFCKHEMHKNLFLFIYQFSHLEAGIDEGVVTLDDQPLEDSVEDGTSDAANSSSCLLASLTWF